MAKLDIVKVPDPILTTKSDPIEKIDNELIKFTDDMLDTMYDAPGIGLAAIQVAVPRRVIVIDISRDDEDRHPVVMINPEILSVGDKPRSHEEGCLSIPEIYAEIERPDEIRVRYQDLDGHSHEIIADGLFSTVIQHEVDHLDGVLFVDHLSRLKRDRLIKKFIKNKKHSQV